MTQSDLVEAKLLKGLVNFESTCISCKFFDLDTNHCKQREMVVSSDAEKCEEWRYYS